MDRHRLVILVGLAFCLFNGIGQLMTYHWQESTTTPATGITGARSLPQQNPKHRKNLSTTTARKQSPIIDIISTGSLHRMEYLDSQRDTFATHPAVRWFRATTEHNDTDAQCHLDLKTEDIEAITKLCHTAEFQTEHAKQIRQKKFSPRKDSPGWLCAQKRPIDGLAALMTKDYTSDELLPDYLILIDDDTYVNVELTLQFLLEYHPASEPHAVSGCRYISPIPINFGFPIGGFGAILTRKTLQNMRKPIHCDGGNLRKEDKFTQFACWRLGINNMLEQQFFRDGMSVADLLFAYAKGLPFSRYREWKEGNGFCFHSDLALAYFVNYYHVAVPDAVLERRALSDQMRMKHLGFINLNNTKDNAQCAFEKNMCNHTAKFCHYVTSTQMREIWMSSR